ncbi:MAG: hypothetical protein EOP06_14765 [Proteobacteria bacterium]|nr:MAG: hypothetical protein EOP06_14765 [Pseudomonadota bacterium]
MINRTMTPALEQELKRKINELETEDKYVTELFAGMKAGRTSHVTEEGGNPDAKRFGTGVPNYLGSIDTFITNPSNVGIGVIARMIETDPTVLSAVSFKSLMMLAKMGEFQHDDVTITEFVRDFLAKMYGPTFKEALEAMSSKFGYGFSVTEIIWGINKQKRKVPIKLSTYHPTTICFEVDQYGELTEWGIVQFVIQSGQTANPNNFLPSFQGGWRVKNPFETPEDRLLPTGCRSLTTTAWQEFRRQNVSTTFTTTC